jgi:hypothetical protein
MSLTFEPLKKPFPRWMGPFSPARGFRSGFRFKDKQLGTYVSNDDDMAFWCATQTDGARKLGRLVLEEWRGGRVLLLANGLVIKPLQKDIEVGRRVIIGRLSGSLVLEQPSGHTFDMRNPGKLKAGDPWHGPKTTGLECAIQQNGSLNCTWYHPTKLGRDTITRTLRGPDAKLAASFGKARPGVMGGRVRLTVGGHLITNRLAGNTWQTLYVGHVEAATLLGDWKTWINGGS